MTKMGAVFRPYYTELPKNWRSSGRDLSEREKRCEELILYLKDNNLLPKERKIRRKPVSGDNYRIVIQELSTDDTPPERSNIQVGERV